MLGNSGFDRQPLGQYFTPTWCTEALLSQVQLRGAIWEPAAGRGDMVSVLEGAGHRVIASDIVGADLGCIGAEPIDFLAATSLLDGVTSVVTNPPYDQIKRFIEHALSLTRDRQGMVAMLARCEFDSAAGRKHLFDRSPFITKVVLTKRPKWSDMDIASPRHNFAWFVWDWHHTGPATLRYAP
jgi:hypothetical protein